MEPGAWVQLNVRADIGGGVQPGAILTNCAELAIDGQESRPNDNTDCVVDRVNNPGPNLRIDKQFRWNWRRPTRVHDRIPELGHDYLEPGQDHRHTAGQYLVQRQLVALVPGGIQFEQLGNQLIWTIGSLESAWSSGLRYEVNLDAGVVGVEGLCYTNTAVAPIPGDVWPGDNQDCDRQPAPGPTSMSKSG